MPPKPKPSLIDLNLNSCLTNRELKPKGSVSSSRSSRLTPSARISGVVRDREGRPLVGVGVRATGRRNGNLTRRATTDASGMYTLRGLYEGEYEAGLSHGYGKMAYADGHIYEGEWQRDQRHGKGKFTSSAMVRYEGEWLEGTYNKKHT